MTAAALRPILSRIRDWRTPDPRKKAELGDSIRRFNSYGHIWRHSLVKRTENSSVKPGSMPCVSWRTFMRGAEAALAERLVGLERITESDDRTVALARAFILAKHGHASEARKQLETIRKDQLAYGGDHADSEFLLVDVHVRVYEDQPFIRGTQKLLNQILESSRPDDFVGQALALNHLCVHALHMGHFDRAQEYAEGAIRCYRQGDAVFGSLHLHAHLGQIKLMRGDLEGAALQYAEMQDRLDQLTDDTSALLAICHALRSEVAYETNDLVESATLLEHAMNSVEEDDAWLDVRAAAYRVRTRLAYIRSGLPGALTELAHCEKMAEARSMPRLLRLMRIERIRVLTLSNEISAARRIMREIGLTFEAYDWETRQDWALRQGTTGVAISRWLVRARRSRDALAFIEPAEDFAIRGGQLLSLAKLRIIRAGAHWRLNQKSDATAALLSALRLLGRQPFRRFILDEGNEIARVVQAALDGERVIFAPLPEQRRKLSELTYYWATHQTGGAAESFHDGTKETHGRANGRQRYLELVAIGHSNKEIAQILGVSVNTVKYHLKILFNDLDATNRMQAVRRGRELGIIR